MAKRTAIVIAHRLSTVKKMDELIVLDRGRIVERGSHEELRSQQGVYAALWEHQSGGFLAPSGTDEDRDSQAVAESRGTRASIIYP